MTETMMAYAKLQTGMRFDVASGSGYCVTLDAAKENGGQNAGFRPMEMLLVGLAGCIGMDVVSILRKNRQQVRGYEIRVVGKRAEDHPMVFTEITVEHVITGYHIQSEMVTYAIHLSLEHYCAADAMLGKVAHITHTCRLIDPAEMEPVTRAEKQAVAVAAV